MTRRGLLERLAAVPLALFVVKPRPSVGQRLLQLLVKIRIDIENLCGLLPKVASSAVKSSR